MEKDSINYRFMLARKALKMTQQKLADEMGLTRSYLNGIENGFYALTQKNMISFCDTFHVSLEWLENGTGEMFTKDKNDFENKIVETLLSLPAEKKRILMYAFKIAEKMNAEKPIDETRQEDS